MHSLHKLYYHYYYQRNYSNLALPLGFSQRANKEEFRNLCERVLQSRE